MKTLDRLRPAPYGDVQTVGIPQALLYYRYGQMWTTFFETLGRRVVVSEPSDRAILEQGDKLSVDECCLASKLYMGHVASLAGKCDAVFVPRYSSYGTWKGFCTKFQSLPDLVKNTLAVQPLDEPVRLMTMQVDQEIEDMDERDAFITLGQDMGASKKDAKEAYECASRVQHAQEQKAHRDLMASMEEASDSEDPMLKILVVAHPYVVHDPFVGKPIIDLLTQMGVMPLFADSYDHRKAYRKSKEFSETLPWLTNRELVGAILNLHDQIDGIVLISAFPCGPDSMANDAIMRYIKGRPVLSITVDAQSGIAGLETRVESFVDILRYQRQGGYTHAN